MNNKLWHQTSEGLSLYGNEIKEFHKKSAFMN